MEDLLKNAQQNSNDFADLTSTLIRLSSLQIISTVSEVYKLIGKGVAESQLMTTLLSDLLEKESLKLPLLGRAENIQKLKEIISTSTRSMKMLESAAVTIQQGLGSQEFHRLKTFLEQDA